MYRDQILENDFGYTTKTKVKDILCTCKDKAVLRKLLPTSETSAPVTCYQSCPRVLYTATMRQLRGPDDSTFKFDQNEIKSYHKYCDKYFDEYIEPLLVNFDYDVEAWMNHLKDYDKQKEVLEFYNMYKAGKKYDAKWEKGAYLNYTVFAKQEKQIVSDKYPKCRAISACPPLMKWLKGPIAVALEKLFHGKLPGFKISSDGKPCKTWGEIERYYEKCHREGKDSIIDIDGSAWDSTQAFHMKYISNKVYNWLYDNNKIKHICPKFFHQQINKRTRKLVAKTYINDKTYIIFSADIDSTTFSGDPGTTLDNTLTNLTLNHWIMDSYGLEINVDYEMDAAGDDYSCKLPAQLNTPQLHEVIKNKWKSLGLIPKYVLAGDYSNITFCSTSVIPYTGDHGQQKFKIVRQLDRMNPLSHYSRKALSYSAGQLKHHYQELSIGMKQWSKGMPFYDDYRKIFQQYADSIPTKPIREKPGKPKMRFISSHGETYDDASTYHNMDKFRVSQNVPPSEAVYDFLITKYGLSKSDIQDMISKLTYQGAYCELNPTVTQTAQYIPYQNY